MSAATAGHQSPLAGISVTSSEPSNDPDEKILSIETASEKQTLPCIDPSPSKDTDIAFPARAESDQEWDFIIPTLDRPVARLLRDETNPPFNLHDLVQNIQEGADARDVYNYLADYDDAVIKREINGDIMGFPAIFYVVARNDEEMLRVWVTHGGDVGVVCGKDKIPLIAFAITHSEMIQEDTTFVLTTLLGLGADPETIPKEFYTPYNIDLPVDGPEAIADISDTPWCTISARKRLGRTLNLSQRYFLWKASKLRRPNSRKRQVAVRKNAEGVLEVPYFLIGQTTASDRVLRRLLNHILIPSTRPLVLVFAGPSGHGKTELARHLGHLLSLDLEVVDCTIVSRELELFGPRPPYVGAENGSPLNNFLAKHADQRCIVFLDEFEKTTKEIHKALLLPFDNGEYQDRRKVAKINCSKTIWILATNALDAEIVSFCDRNEDIIIGDELVKEELGKQLSKELKKGFISHFGVNRLMTRPNQPPITGRISEFIPFVPFSPGEQAVVAHKFLRELSRYVREPINLSDGRNEHIIGNVKLQIKHDASVCNSLAAAEYSRDLGARSLSGAVKIVEGMVAELYLEQNEEIAEGGKVLDVVVDAHAGEILVELVH
ncbi:P-loop containing nucleoside triphosphate hydrolase protein [Melanomma pulvis-pyrius CBS 109.77]|uniref:P-loop containing nucleoside triphosphate hydrolase protein n=1 Tax=Melanomma pulvis-pyrius CBS 109.77 TaxID=1314802 RepID=A0A6A6XNS7_9PLEO|nr:P-loop containing nucleoside triphosphate hydrolase protein [Melanomma pulvis-pyrius CBS 109.77]